jgi:RNA polymerase-associated protein RTF1
MDESDSETEVPQKVAKGEDIDEKYPVESLYVSLAEKAQIMKMREVERETILAERREENQKIKQNRILRQLVTAQEEKEKEQQRRKRSADDADLEEGSRKTARQRTRLDGTLVGETSTGIGDLRRARAEKSDRQRRREEDRERQRGRMSPDQAARDQEGPGDADDEWLRSRTPEHEIEAKLADFERLRIGRNNFAEICFKPGLEDTLIDCYVRVLGKPDRHGDQRYHILAIKGRRPTPSRSSSSHPLSRIYHGAGLCDGRG